MTRHDVYELVFIVLILITGIILAPMVYAIS